MSRIGILCLVILFASSVWSADTLYLLPNADGTLNQWTLSEMEEHWEHVDDPVGTPDEDGSYLYTSAVNDTQEINHATNDTLIDKTILNVRMYTRMRKAGLENDCEVELSLNSGGTIGIGDTVVLTGSYVTYNDDWVEDPQGGAWTKADIDALQSRLVTTVVGAITNARCTQMYLAVAYEEAAAGGIILID